MASSGDVVLVAAAVHPMHAGYRGGEAQPADAIRIRDGRIVAVGPRHEVLGPTRAAATEVVDLGDATILPGLIEPHTHPDLCAQVYAWVDVSGFRHATAAEVHAALAEAAAATPAGQWIFAFGLDFMLTSGLDGFDRSRLDAITDRHPVFVMIQSMHTAYANSLALRMAGITDDTPDPPGGGHYDRDDDGRLTGRMEEAPSMAPFIRHIDSAHDALRRRLETQYGRYRDVGITSLGVAGLFSSRAEAPVFFDVASAATTPIRSTVYLRHQQANRISEMDALGERIRVPGVKLWYDGSPYTGTMLVDDPYLETELCCCRLGIPAGTVGRANHTPDELRGLLADLAAAGHQVLTHAQGDRGCSEMLDLYAEALGPHHRDLRWRLEHCALIRPSDLERAASLGVSPSFHVDHVRHYGPELRDAIIGPERAARLMPIRSAIDCGHRPSLHADSPMYPPGPLGLVRTAVTRLARTGEVIGPDQGIDLDAALRAVTLDAAWQLHDDTETGSIAPGKRADFSVLDTDPYAVAAADLDHIEVLGTWIDGRPTSA